MINARIRWDEEHIPLTIEMVPETCWYSNLRYNLQKYQWDKIRLRCYDEANRECEICGEIGSMWPVECHEKWVYETETIEEGYVNKVLHIQRLVGMVALCPICHLVKHWGRTMKKEDEEDRGKALYKILTVNDWTTMKFEMYLQYVKHQYIERSEWDWVQDTTILQKEGWL